MSGIENTITSYDDFQRRVTDASWEKPVLIKFGLTYCVHCLLMENLGSVPAVAKNIKINLLFISFGGTQTNRACFVS